jgi:twitching motility protein PilT
MEVAQLLELSIDSRASDLHILPEVQPMMRIDGVLTVIKNLPVFSAAESKTLLYSILTPEQQQVLEKELVLELAVATPKGNFRVSVFHQMHGLAGVFRVIPQRVPTIEELDLPAVLKKLLIMSRGLIIAAGPTGCGKSTTLAAMLDYINTYRVANIFTIEDPIEFVHQNKRSVFNQIQVGRDTPDFATALKASLRQDPNVIMLGELRDLETMRLALTAVETGHLVLATMHASSAPLSISRFADVFPSEEKNRVRTLLSETLEAVVCQRLVKKTTGGRVAAFEIMLMTPSIRHFVRQDMPAHMESAIQTGGDRGMITFEVSLNELVKKRLISQLTASTVMNEVKSFIDTATKSTLGK